MPPGVGLFAYYREFWQHFTPRLGVSNSLFPRLARKARFAPPTREQPDFGPNSRHSLTLAPPGLTAVASAQSLTTKGVALGEQNPNPFDNPKKTLPAGTSAIVKPAKINHPQAGELDAAPAGRGSTPRSMTTWFVNGILNRKKSIENWQTT